MLAAYCRAADVDRQDERAGVREDALAANLFATPASSILGVMAKLGALLGVMEPAGLRG
ncbi:hypothetical protein [Kaistia soli]|uniref:hypothetical protein n=1 Tax=Kaistia soli TaxID=446684 RepID=UPI0015882423|nr:hypothetical protein [Kaistia soli]